MHHIPCRPLAAGGRRGGVILAAAMAALALPLAAQEQPAVSVTRLLPACWVSHDLTVQADLVVELAEGVPQALIVEEEPPAGWTLTAATWMQDGLAEPLPTTPVGGRHKWLFDPLGLPVGNGFIRVTFATPTAAAGEYTLQGAAKWMEAGTESGCTVDSQCTLAVSTLHRGWNALSLPFRVPDCDALDRLFCDAAGTPLLLRPVHVWDGTAGEYVPATGAIEPGQGFLGCILTAACLHVFVAAGPAADLHLNPGWTFTGVRQAVRLGEIRACEPDIGMVFRWDDPLGSYRALGDDDLLIPGVAYWIYLGRMDPAVIPLAGQP